VGTKLIKVNYTDLNGCSGAVPAQLVVIVKPAPVPAIIGSTSCCLNVNTVYSTTPFQSNYVWTVSPGDSIKSGQGTKSVTVKWKNTGMRWISLNYTGANGCAAPAPSVKNVTVNSCKALDITGEGISSSDIQMIGLPDELPDDIGLSVYPNPNTGMFTVVISSPEPDDFNLQIFSNLGTLVYNESDIRVNGTVTKEIDIREVANGVYNVVLAKNDLLLQKRIVVRK
jgi:hypothetical protein